LGRTWDGIFLSPWAADSQIPFPAWFKSKGEVRVHESELFTQAGERYRVRWKSIPLRDTSGTTIGLASIGEDMNEKRRLEGKLLDSSVRKHWARESTDRPKSEWERSSAYIGKG